MFHMITNNFRLISRMGSLGSKIIGLGMTGFGLAKLWSPESTKKHSAIAISAFSGAYVLHMSSTILTTAVMFGSESVSPQVATALLSGTSLLTSYVNLMEAYLSHSFLKLKSDELEIRFNASNLNLQRSLALVQSVTDAELEMQSLNEQFGFLQSIKTRLQEAKANAELKEMYLTLFNYYQERISKNQLWLSYYNEIKAYKLDLDGILNDLREKISATHAAINEVTIKLQMAQRPKSKDRFQSKLNLYEKKLKEYGVLNIQCIRYVKIEEHIKLLEKLIVELNTDQSSTIPKSNEIPFLEARIHALRALLGRGIHPQEYDPIFDLEIGMTMTLDDTINDDPAAFKSWLENRLIPAIRGIEEQRDRLQININNIERCFREYINEPINDIQAHRLNIRKIQQDKVQLKCELSLEKLNEEAKKTRFNLSTVASLLALAMCLVPQSNVSTIVNPLMLGIGFLGGVSSLWSFYTKNLLTEKVNIQKQNSIKRLDKALAFTHANDLAKTSSVDLERLLSQSVPIQLDKPKRVMPSRKAKDKANELIFRDRRSKHDWRTRRDSNSRHPGSKPGTLSN